MTVQDNPIRKFSKGDVKRAGKMLAGDLIWTDETAEAILRAFQVANWWRDAHGYPMRSIRQSVIQFLTRGKIEGLTAARLKRMQAVRRKLRRPGTNLGLHQLQDLGGCRVLLDSIEDVHALVRMVRENMRHDLRDEDDYIAIPKVDGYRSHHLMFTFRGDEPFDGKRIELQVRTRLQHSWATAVEAVSLFRNADLKSKHGLEGEVDLQRRQENADWLRLFLLLSAEFAETEDCPIPADTMHRHDRLSDIRELSKSLDALSLLESIRIAVLGTDVPTTPGYEPTHYLIRFDHATKSVSTRAFRKPDVAAMNYDLAEALGNQTDNGAETVVLVEVDKLENLREAYPNYYGDVAFFSAQLRAIIKGRAAMEYSTAVRQPPRPLAPAGDFSWLRHHKFRRY